MRFLVIVLNNPGIGRGLIKPIMELPCMQARHVTSRARVRHCPVQSSNR